MKLIITVSNLDHIPEKELAESPFDSELDFYIDLIYADPYLLFDGATFELIENNKTPENQLLHKTTADLLDAAKDALYYIEHLHDPTTAVPNPKEYLAEVIAKVTQ